MNDEIIKLYNEGKTCLQIGNVIGHSKSYVVKRLGKLGIKKRTSQDYFRGKKTLGVFKSKRHHAEITTVAMMLLYEKGFTGDEIALVYGVNRSCVYKRFRDAGVKMRTTGDYTGPRHWRYKGHEYFPDKVRKRQTNHMKKWQRAVKERDGNKCRNCNSTEILHAHHIIPYLLCYSDNRVYDINNGITLCRDCHAKVHSRKISVDQILSKTK